MQLHSVTGRFWIRLATGFPDNHVSPAGALDGAAICFSTGALTEAWLELPTTEEEQGPAASSALDSDPIGPPLFLFADFLRVRHRWSEGRRVTRRERVSGRSPFRTNRCFSFASHLCELSKIISVLSPSRFAISDRSDRCCYENVIQGAHAKAGIPNTQQPVCYKSKTCIVQTINSAYKWGSLSFTLTVTGFHVHF